MLNQRAEAAARWTQPSHLSPLPLLFFLTSVGFLHESDCTFDSSQRGRLLQTSRALSFFGLGVIGQKGVNLQMADF